MKTKDRLDKLLVEKGLAKSREMAKAFIMAGKVSIDGNKGLKAGSMVDSDSVIFLKECDIPYVSRGGLKLEAALRFFDINPSGMIVMDIGCSTGGFTDCVLKNNAKKVYAVDVGYGQFDWSLRQNPKIVLLEKTNIRYLDKGSVSLTPDLILIDVSFISLSKVLPKTIEFLKADGAVLALIKPQFEVGKGMVEKGGIVRDITRRKAAVENIRDFSETIGFKTLGIFESPVHGQKGNIEYFIYLRKI
jgi:23S rRNA (cytidine1920-2'-O)/16S rRNA (cytidine1409-2'-O)-methyltransferase